MRPLPPGLLAAGVLAATLALPAPLAGAATELVPEAVHRAGSVAEARARTPIATGRPDDGQHAQISPVDRRGRTAATGRGLTPALARAQAQNLAHVQSGAALSTWAVTYDVDGPCSAPTADQDTALRRAVSTWSHIVASSVTISVVVCFTSELDADQLGGAGPMGFQSFGGVYFPDALGNALTGQDDAPGVPDISASFSNAAGLYYYGAEPSGIASCPGDCFDFESVVLHELGHGLGFFGSLDVDDQGVATYGLSPTDTRPLAYDVFAETSGGTPILAYPNRSAALRSAITSNVVYWAGPEGAGADRGREPRLHAPFSWEPGSSFSHLSLSSYPAGDADRLMTPAAEANDVIRDPGEVALGMFRDMGWTTPALPGLRYVPLAGPVQVLAWGPAGNGALKDVTIAGARGVPSNAAAVVLNLTQTATTSQNSQLLAYAKPRSAPQPPPARVPNLVTAGGYTKDALATVPLGLGGVRFKNVGGTAHSYASVLGYFVRTGGSPYFSALPKRVVDTRTGLGTRKARITTTARTVTISGVPTSAVAVALNVTALSASNTSTLQVYNSNLTTPATGNVHLKPGGSATNLVVAKLGTNHAVKLRMTLGSADVAVDIAGWYGPSATALFRPVLPQRVSGPALLGATVRDRKVEGLNEGYGVPLAATSLVLSTIASFPSKPSFLSVYGRGTFPGITTMVVVAGKSASGPSMTRASTDGYVRVRNTAGTSTLSIDLFGYYSP